jgi:hypothetical protein
MLPDQLERTPRRRRQCLLCATEEGDIEPWIGVRLLRLDRSGRGSGSGFFNGSGSGSGSGSGFYGGSGPTSLAL